MPWKTKRLLLLMACGFGALALAIVVLVRSRVREQSGDIRLLAIVALLGGIAILLTNLPGNGEDKKG